MQRKEHEVLWGSKIGDLLACPYRAKILYWDKLRRIDRPSYLTFGSAAHVVHALFLHPKVWVLPERQKRELGYEVAEKANLDAYGRELLRSFVQLFDFRRFEELGIEPLTVEMKISAVVPGGTAVLGRADALVLRNGEPWLVEFKTTGQLSGAILEKAYMGNFQLLLYTYILNRILKHPIRGVLATVFVKRKRNPEFVIEPIPLEPGQLPGNCPPGAVEETVALARAIAERISSGDAPRCLASCFGMFGTRCECFEICRYNPALSAGLYALWDPEEHIEKLFVEELPETVREVLK